MKVLQINAIYGAKSTGVIVRDIHALLQTKGYDSYVMAPVVENADNNVICTKNKIDSRIHALLTRLVGIQGLGSIIKTKTYLKKIDKIKPDIIHVHNIHSNFLNYKLLLKYTARNKIPVVMTLHDSWLFTGKCYHFLDIGCERWLTECHSCPKRYQEIPSVIVDNSSRIFKLRKKLYALNRLNIVGCSQWITNCASKSPLFEGAEKMCIYNGIDVNIFSDKGENLREETKSENKFVILVMANKWFEGQNRAITQEILQNLEPNDRIIIIGCKDEQIFEHENVKCLGYVKEQKELAKIYRTADVFLNLTRVDTLPTVNMEAAACGIPVITFDAGGSGELVNEGISGYIIPSGNISEIIKAIQKIKAGCISNEECRKWAIKHFERNTNYEKYITLYTNIKDRVDKNF